ncbi:MAG: PilZ domain-containing protein [Dokdonella sp.]|uniref:PilZ domain-containing protein n=1 Tax=Dokdonella sp. TaxID=2291710 RepID=UPI0025BA605E|nr:PilZ domain-containing protein [Dokdonella sp.]MBZ0223475.1 PilZ domain-containing protein [Dokdonella sp.]MCC7256622.1 PilZ domain-containing protein [Dokdonella sp.]
MTANPRQRAARKRPDHTIVVVDQMTGEPAGHVGNLSLSGMLLIADHPFVEDALYQLAFSLPHNHGQRTIEIGAHEQWLADGTVHGQQWVGLQFIDISEDDENVLRQWLEHAADEER